MIGSLATAFERDGADVVVRLPEGMHLRYSVSTSPDVEGAEWQEGSGELRVVDNGGALYLHVDLDGERAVVGPRRVAMDGTLNFRDLGGYVGADGRVTRWGRLFRADHLGGLTDADVARLDALGVSRVIDFRSDAEQAEYGTLSNHPRAGHIAVQREPIVEALVEGVTPLERIMRREITSWTAQDMARMYQTMLDNFAPRFGAVVEAVAAQQSGALVFHCTAGKDRTGLAAALVLATVGVAHRDIVADYELTNRYRTARRVADLRPRFEAAGIDIEPLMAFFAPPTEAIEAALDHLDSHYGGAAAYLLTRAGVPEAALGGMAESLLAPVAKP